MVTDPDLDKHLAHWGINMLQVCCCFDCDVSGARTVGGGALLRICGGAFVGVWVCWQAESQLANNQLSPALHQRRTQVCVVNCV